MDQLLSGPLAGHPDYPGHPGANWMVYAPWASNGVHDAITGDFSVFGIHPSESQRQAAADGNQWIYGDIGAKYASFLEFYDEHPNPTPEQLQTYFADSYGTGDRQMQTGMAAYSELMTTDDPVRRQELAYQGNVLPCDTWRPDRNPELITSCCGRLLLGRPEENTLKGAP